MTGPNETRPQARWLSQSAWGDYECCPRRYWHGYVDGTPPDRATWRGWRFGRAVHAALEAGYRHVQGTTGQVGDPPSLAIARAALREASEAEDLDAAKVAEADVMVVDSLQSCTVRGHQVLEVESFLRGQTSNGTPVTGRPDLVLEHADGSLEICDHKISRFPVSPEQLAGDRQLLLYAWMAAQRWTSHSPMVVSHHYPPLQRVVRATVSPARIDRVLAELDAVAAAIAGDQHFPPVPGDHCRTCRWVSRCPAAPAWALASG